MKHTFTLARFHFTIDFTAEMVTWLHENFPDDWFVVEDGRFWVASFWDDWQGVVEAVVYERIRRYFVEIKVPEGSLPRVDQVESYGEPWRVDARVVMEGSNSQVETILQGASKSVVDIVREVADLREDILREVVPRLGDAIEKTLFTEIEGLKEGAAGKRRSKKPRQPLPEVMVAVELVINPRPMEVLRTLEPLTSEVHLRVRISRSKFWLANLGTASMKKVQMGVFRGKEALVQFVYGDAFMGHVDRLNPQEEVELQMANFENAKGEKLDFSDGARTHVGCWVKDERGIFLFEFVLEEE